MIEPVIGKVYLVGAGPGDPELLTVKALRILRQADFVLHDDLVPPPILGLASPDACVVNVGKRCGKKSVSQSEINTRMIAAARQGLTVARLKGGDPSIFGRAGEEIEALRQAEVQFEVVPGVTAASASAAAAGISLTHRHLASSVVFLTGHPADQSASGSARESNAPDHAPPHLADTTVVIYMPGPNYQPVSAQLQAAGISRETPCVIVSSASSGAQRVHKTTVEKLANVPPLAPPAILLVGEVTRFACDHSPAGLPFLISSAAGDHELSNQLHPPRRT